MMGSNHKMADASASFQRRPIATTQLEESEDRRFAQESYASPDRFPPQNPIEESAPAGSFVDSSSNAFGDPSQVLATP